MIANETLKTPDNTEVMLFPMDCMYITQGEGGPLSHILAMDFVGWNGSQQIYTYPYYAPCTCKCVARNDVQAWLVFESINPVLCADNVTRYVCFVVMHDNNPLYQVNDVVFQGSILGHTGTARVCSRRPLAF